LGVSRRRILRGVLLEGAALAVAGAVFGVLFALALQGLVNRLFQWRYDTPLVFVRVTGAIALRSVAFAVPLGILAGWVASWSLLRREIGALLRR
jgi:ABC-type antimicrobial peptide transport system permease subunit